MRNFIKELATDVALTVAAVIGTVWMLAAIGTLVHQHTASEQPAHTTASQIFVCDAYLSHGAMVTNQELGIAPAPSFCVA